MNLADIEAGGSPIVVANGSARPTGGSGPVERLTLARPVLPCPGCAHAPVCSIRPLLDEGALAFRAPSAPHAAIHVRLAVEVTCDHFLAGDVVGAVEPVPAAPTNAERLAVSRKRGQAGLAKVRAKAGGGPGKRSGFAGRNHTPEMRERISAAMRASHERRRAAASGSAAPE